MKNWASFYKIKDFKNWSYQKLSKAKNVLPNSYFLMIKEKKNDGENWLWKSNFDITYLPPPHYVNSQNTIFSFEYCWFSAKHISNLVSLPMVNFITHKNHTTHTHFNLYHKVWIYVKRFLKKVIICKSKSFYISPLFIWIVSR